jgi:hypothetical protein
MRSKTFNREGREEKPQGRRENQARSVASEPSPLSFCSQVAENHHFWLWVAISTDFPLLTPLGVYVLHSKQTTCAPTQYCPLARQLRFIQQR